MLSSGSQCSSLGVVSYLNHPGERGSGSGSSPYESSRQTEQRYSPAIEADGHDPVDDRLKGRTSTQANRRFAGFRSQPSPSVRRHVDSASSPTTSRSPSHQPWPTKTKPVRPISLVRPRSHPRKTGGSKRQPQTPPSFDVPTYCATQRHARASKSKENVGLLPLPKPGG